MHSIIIYCMIHVVFVSLDHHLECANKQKTGVTSVMYSTGSSTYDKDE